MWRPSTDKATQLGDLDGGRRKVQAPVCREQKQCVLEHVRTDCMRAYREPGAQVVRASSRCGWSPVVSLRSEQVGRDRALA